MKNIQQTKNILWDRGFLSNENATEFSKENKFFRIKHGDQMKFYINSIEVFYVFDEVDNLQLLSFLCFDKKSPFEFNDFYKSNIEVMTDEHGIY